MTEPTLPDPVETREPGAPEPAATKKKRTISPKDVVAIVFLILIVIFVAENGIKTPIRFVGPQVTTYLWLALLIAAAFGFALGFALAWRRNRRAEK